jgi:hypothetical protein
MLEKMSFLSHTMLKKLTCSQAYNERMDQDKAEERMSSEEVIQL